MDKKNSIRLIQLYRSYRFLWDVNDKHYHKKMKREDAWKEISAKMQYPVAVLKAKMKALMGSFRSERSRVNKSRVNESDSEYVHKSKWFAYTYFDFLSDKNKPRETVKTETAQSKEQYGIEISTESILPTASAASVVSAATQTSAATEQKELERTERTNETQTTGTKGKATEQDIDSRMMNRALKIIQSSVDSSNDPYFTYALHLSNELRKYDPNTLAHVKRAFANILFNADMGTYSTHSSYGTPYQSPIPYTSSISSIESSTTSHE